MKPSCPSSSPRIASPFVMICREKSINSESGKIGGRGSRVSTIHGVFQHPDRRGCAEHTLQCAEIALVQLRSRKERRHRRVGTTWIPSGNTFPLDQLRRTGNIEGLRNQVTRIRVEVAPKALGPSNVEELHVQQQAGYRPENIHHHEGLHVLDRPSLSVHARFCLLYTSDAADDLLCV